MLHFLAAVMAASPNRSGFHYAEVGGKKASSRSVSLIP
jgi:hypothetical protein